MAVYKILVLFLSCLLWQTSHADTFYPADNGYFQYVGRIDFSTPATPRFWASGVYVTARFKGPRCEIVLNDEMLYGTNHNYVSIIIDNKAPVRQQLLGKSDTIRLHQGLGEGPHTIVICKNTEAGIGYMEFAGLRCQKLLPLPVSPVRKIEFIGNSITCGSGSDQSSVPCGQGQWYDQHNAWKSYGPLTARQLNAQWQLSSVSGIGLVQSCCGMPHTMPKVFDKVNMYRDSIPWDFANFQPDVVAVTLGENDGPQDSARFCQAYVTFLKRLRTYYPAANIVCIDSPMADRAFSPILQRYITAVVAAMQDKKVSKYFYSRKYQSGCGGHPDLAQHQLMANELTAYIKKIKHW